MRVVWKGVCSGRDVRVLLDSSENIYVESMSRDLLGGERWEKIPEMDTFDGINRLWIHAVTRSFASMAKELGR